MDQPGSDDPIIRIGDRVTIFLKGKKHTATLSEGRLSLGNFSIPGKELVGKNFGSIEVADMKFTVLPAIARDHMETMNRGPQVILPGDASTILFHAGITSGKKVLEAGSGSGGLTIALASAVAPSGRILSLDIRPANLEIARKNLRKAGLQHQVTFAEGDIKDPVRVGLLVQELNIQEMDVVVLDMPDPWEAMDTVRNVLRIGGSLVVYLPTMNQVERIRGELEGWDGTSGGFVDIFTQETLTREIKVSKGAVRPEYSMLGHTAYLTFARRSG